MAATIAKTPGRRTYPVPMECGHLPLQEPGDYWLGHDGWACCTPNGMYGTLSKHHVEEHEDGTISVVHGLWGSNSILVSDGEQQWHGAIVRGEWREF